MPARLQGVLAPVVTPFRPDLAPDAERFARHCRWLLDRGVGLAVFGTNSEANSLSAGERVDLLDALIAAGIPAARMMPGTGTCALTDTVRLTAHAVQAGCAGVLMLPPFYYKGVSDEGVFRAVAEVIERVGNVRLRVYVYNIPPIAVVGYSLAVIERLLKAYPGVVIGMKDSSGNWAYQESVLDRFPGFDVFTGSERFLLANLRMGGVGTISAMANVIPAKIRFLYDNYLAENADQVQERLDRYREATRDYAAIPALKQIMANRTGDRTWLNLRPPLVNLSEVATHEMLAKYAAA